MQAAGIAILALLQASPLRTAAPAERTVAVTPGPGYEAGWFRRFLFGKGWRNLWVTELTVPVAALDTLRGGLTAFDRGGSGQTLALRFCTPDGRIYQFRSMDKNPGQHATGLKRSAPIQWVYRNHISAMFPAGALAVGKLEAAAGLPATERWIAVLPDSPRLGKWRDDFKGMLGIFERRHIPDEKECFPELPGTEVISSDTLLARTRAKGTDWADQSTYLRARLVDILVNDADRHADQWSWQRADRGGLAWWTPIPRDRDWALSHNDGFLYHVARRIYPVWIKFTPNYRSIRGLTEKSQSLDRLLLTGMDRQEWDSTVAQLQRRLTDAQITAAVNALPEEFDRATLEYLARSLKSRRDALPIASDKFYRGLAQVVEVQGTQGSERIEVNRGDDGTLVMELFAPNRARVWQRRFDPRETDEIRLYLQGGADSVRVRGHEEGIPLRVITGGGADHVSDSTGGDALRVYDDSGTARVSATGPVRRVVRPPEKLPRRDWGRGYSLAPWFGVRPELGMLVGGGPVFYSYGFRRVPYKSRITLRAATTTKAGEINADLKADFRFEQSDRKVLLKAKLLNADVIRYFGFGNETVRAATSGTHNVIQKVYSLEPTAELGIAGPLQLRLGGFLRWSDTDEERATLLTLERPYGTGSFAEAGASAALRIDTRDHVDLPTKGVTLELNGRVFPALLDVRSAFGSVGVLGTSYFTARSLPLDPTLAFQFGAQRALGTPPFFEAPDLGGWQNFRGLTTRRFIGDAAVHANADLRLNVGSSLGGGSWGVLGLGDLGRVFQDGESSSRWHYGLGAGLWMAVTTHVFTATLSSGGERLRFYIKSGFHF